MTAKEIITALRCTAIVDRHEDCAGCPYHVVEQVPGEDMESFGTKTWTRCCTGNFSAYSLMTLKTCFIAVCLSNHTVFSLLLLFTAFTGFTFFTTNMLSRILDTLALIRLRRTLFTDFRCKLTNLLLIGTRNNNLIRSRYVD